jgi:uncharacterized membrane protein YoaK (UPF0700 family)
MSRERAVLGTSLAFVAGYVDTLGFVALFGLFTAHVTGNFVTMGATLAGSAAGVLAKLLALPVFVVTVALVRLFVRARASSAVPLLLAQAALLGTVVVLGRGLVPPQGADALGTIVVGLVAVAAMAVQNAAARTVFASLAPTTVMTGNVTQFVIDAVDRVASRDPAVQASARARMASMGGPIVGFAAGALGGGVAYFELGFGVLLLPILLLVAICALPSARAAVPSPAP